MGSKLNRLLTDALRAAETVKFLTAAGSLFTVRPAPRVMLPVAPFKVVSTRSPPDADIKPEALLVSAPLLAVTDSCPPIEVNEEFTVTELPAKIVRFPAFDRTIPLVVMLPTAPLVAL